MELQIQDVNPKPMSEGFPKKPLDNLETLMTSSTVSSLSSPVDSGVQMDSESELTSVMSVSGFTSEIYSEKFDETDEVLRIFEEKCDVKKPLIEEVKSMTKSDIINQNISEEYKKLSASVPNYFDSMKYEVTSSSPMLQHKSLSDDVFEMEHPIKTAENTDIMNVSLTSYELLDYTLQNKSLLVENNDMHVSLSEEVNENLRLSLNQPEPVPPVQAVSEEIPVNAKQCEEQIVFRRQRKKKSKSDTPKKRVSFHEDILNSTKIDDIHINHGFITHEPEVSLSFFQRGFIRKPDVVKGRYSWAAEGDAPYYEKPKEREVKSDIYVNRNKHSSTSSSSTGSSSSIDEEDSDETFVKKEPSFKSKPKSSCLKKTKHTKKYIDTNIVEEDIGIKKRKSDSNLLDTNIFGSLKNILNFSTSVPLAERGVSEGQEDLTVYASSREPIRRPFGDLKLRCFETIEIPTPAVNKLNQAKNNLKLTRNEGFYPSYPVEQNLPGNIILCDSNVYEHKGISYSYEYDKFQKSFEQQKPKSSTVYQMILKELNFFRRKAREEQTDPEEDFEIIQTTPTKSEDSEDIENVDEPEIAEAKSETGVLNTFSTISKMDWSDNETLSDLAEPQNPKHLSSPKRKVNKSNHYSICNSFKASSERFDELMVSKSLPTMRQSSSKTSLINRFLKNVTVKKLLDIKAQNYRKTSRRDVDLYIKGVRDVPTSEEIDRELENEIISGRKKITNYMDGLDKRVLTQFRKDIFTNKLEKLQRLYNVRSAYTTAGESKPLLLILTDTTLYITSSKSNVGTYKNHFVLPYKSLDTVLIGPQSQTIHFSNYDKDMQCMISTGCSVLTGDLVGQLEFAIRKDKKRPTLPAVKQLSMRDMVMLRREICKQTSVHKEEEYYYYSIVNVQDCTLDVQSTPLGPKKEGPLMFKTPETESSRWETAYFILKAGVLYMLSSPSQRVPMRVFPLINGACQGARRVVNSARPHTFQLIIEGKSLLLAAPNEYVASEWLQELVRAASGMYNSYKEKIPTQSCSLMITSEHVLTVREAFPAILNGPSISCDQQNAVKSAQALSCASIVDLMAFRLPSTEQSWCLLEFACREVHEYSGDWILYFASNAELEKFISTLENLWHYNNERGECFPLSTIPETDPLSKKCVDVYTSLIGNWPTDSSPVLLQFL
ncbi:unnamed protein product [Phyllotreta striolata]|uniref:PH domain-containing protein n=1 Tax=Phyllotreta striolata TaxID=444603 RepID=A0A9N9XJA6_PHYSR|nr:unnamed protein product [Phyllotreta striolata]